MKLTIQKWLEESSFAKSVNEKLDSISKIIDSFLRVNQSIDKTLLSNQNTTKDLVTLLETLINIMEEVAKRQNQQTELLATLYIMYDELALDLGHSKSDGTTKTGASTSLNSVINTLNKNSKKNTSN